MNIDHFLYWNYGNEPFMMVVIVAHNKDNGAYKVNKGYDTLIVEDSSEDKWW